jgi:6-phosphogluconolactonase (cycloisomerase 2 family)
VTNSGDNALSQYMISSDGSLTSMATATVIAGAGPISVTVDPSGKYAYVASYDSNTVLQYTISANGSLTPMATPTVAAGTGPYFVTIAGSYQ